MMERVDESVIEAVKRGEPVMILGRRYTLAAEVERLRAIETRLQAAITGADIYTEFGTADLRHFLGEGS